MLWKICTKYSTTYTKCNIQDMNIVKETKKQTKNILSVILLSGHINKSFGSLKIPVPVIQHFHLRLLIPDCATSMMLVAVHAVPHKYFYWAKSWQSCSTELGCML